MNHEHFEMHRTLTPFIILERCAICGRLNNGFFIEGVDAHAYPVALSECGMCHRSACFQIGPPIFTMN